MLKTGRQFSLDDSADNLGIIAVIGIRQPSGKDLLEESYQKPLVRVHSRGGGVNERHLHIQSFRKPTRRLVAIGILLAWGRSVHLH